MPKIAHVKERRRRQNRKRKLHTLRDHYLKAKTEEEKEKILGKAKRVAVWLSQEEFLEPITSKE